MVCCRAVAAWESALRLAGKAAALGHEPGEVALLNATTFAVLGLHDQARNALQVARGSSVPESRIASNAVLRRTGLAGPAAQAQEDRHDTRAPAASPRGG